MTPRIIRVYSENNLFQYMDTLRRRREKRQHEGVFFLEGVRPINQALAHGWRVVGHGLGLTFAGAVIGLIGAATASRLLASMLFQVSRLDPMTYATVVAMLTAVALLAAWLPARRAAAVDPTIALRAE